MKYLKQKTLSKFTPNDDALMVYDARGISHTANGSRAVMDLTGALRLPKGTQNQRPAVSGVRTPNGANGFIRYNTTTDSIEGYVAGAWETVRAPGATAIQISRFAANGTETTFGPLNTSYVGAYSVSDHNIIVLVENVWQIGGSVNYTVVQSTSGSLSGPGAPYADGYYVQFGSAVPAFGGTGDPVYVTVYYGYAN